MSFQFFKASPCSGCTVGMKDLELVVVMLLLLYEVSCQRLFGDRPELWKL